MGSIYTPIFECPDMYMLLFSTIPTIFCLHILLSLDVLTTHVAVFGRSKTSETLIPTLILPLPLPLMHVPVVPQDKPFSLLLLYSRLCPTPFL